MLGNAACLATGRCQNDCRAKVETTNRDDFFSPPVCLFKYIINFYSS